MADFSFEKDGRILDGDGKEVGKIISHIEPTSRYVVYIGSKPKAYTDDYADAKRQAIAHLTK
jgi:hypothetical protein